MEEDPPKVTLESVDSRSGFILLKHKKSDLTSKKIKKEQAIALLDEKPEELKKRKADMGKSFLPLIAEIPVTKRKYFRRKAKKNDTTLTYVLTNTAAHESSDQIAIRPLPTSVFELALSLEAGEPKLKKRKGVKTES